MGLPNLRLLSVNRFASLLHDPALISMGARLVTLPVAALCGLLIATQVSGANGLAGYAIFASITALPALVSFLDFGRGAVVTNLIAARWSPEASDVQTLHGIRKAINFCGAISLCVVAGAGIAALTMSTTISYQWIEGLRWLVFYLAFAIPASLGGRMLVGLGETHFLVGCQTAGSVAALGGVAAASVLAPSLSMFVLATLGGQLLGSLACCVIAVRHMGISPMFYVARSVRHASEPEGALKTAAAMFVIGVASAVSLQADRPILAWRLGAGDQLAQYSAAAQIYTPLFGALFIGSQALWARLIPRTGRFTGEDGDYSFKRAQIVCFAMGLALCFPLVAIGPKVVSIVLHTANIDYSLFWAFSILLLSHSIFLPYSVTFVSGSKAMLQAFLYVISTPINVVLSIVAADTFGAVGPIMASVVVTLTLLALPLAVYRRFTVHRPLPPKPIACHDASPIENRERKVGQRVWKRF